MSEIRKDPMAHRWVVMAPERANRPINVCDEVGGVAEAFDPFAEGSEHATPCEIAALRVSDSVPNGPGWLVRVVPNKFPALQARNSDGIRIDGIYESMSGTGAHEVIIECPHAETNLSHLTAQNICEVFWIYRERLIDLKKNPSLVHASVFKNKGALAGASIHHSHSQLIATPVVPVVMMEELAAASDYFHQNGQSLFEMMIQQEIAAGSRIVLITPGFIVFCPYASRFPYETWILPRHPGSHFETISRPAAEELGIVLKTILCKLELALDDPPYNYVIHTAPFNPPELPHYRWHLEIYPRTTRAAGFEWGSGTYINTVLPEVAAKCLRDTAVPI